MSDRRRGSSRLWIAALVIGVATAQLAFRAATPVQYTFTFPEAEHHWMQVEAVFSELAAGPIELRMSRSSPGRYSVHDFAKNVYGVRVTGADGRDFPTTRTDPYGWTVPEHGESITVTYKVFGDVIDGTYLAVDRTHAHINMPAVIMWARGLDDRPATVTFVPPPGQPWRVVTQLHEDRAANGSGEKFTAPNLQYLMDSPAEFGSPSIRTFSVDGRSFRFSAHHTGTDLELDGFVEDVEKIVRQEAQIFGEYPAYDSGQYTFIADYLPYSDEDGMEHRNSTILTNRGTIRGSRFTLLDTVAHEFFHSWNVERIRPRSIEPFDLDRVNMSDELWMAEGFTQYYGPLTLSRAGLADLRTTAFTFGSFANSALLPAHQVRSAVEMSRMGAFTDRSSLEDRTNWANTVISYYDLGASIAMALDLTLRERSGGRVTLDDYMRAMWRVHGKPGGAREGYVDHPYTLRDAEARLAEVSGDAAFARDFFARYIEGREAPDFTMLFKSAGMEFRRQYPASASWGSIRIDFRNGARIAVVPPSNSPVYLAGLDVNDQIRQFDGRSIGSNADITAILQRHQPGDKVSIVYADQTGTVNRSTVTLIEDQSLELVPMESLGAPLTSGQSAFRDAWLGKTNP